MDEIVASAQVVLEGVDKISPAAATSSAALRNLAKTGADVQEQLIRASKKHEETARVLNKIYQDNARAAQGLGDEVEKAGRKGAEGLGYMAQAAGQLQKQMAGALSVVAIEEFIRHSYKASVEAETNMRRVQLATGETSEEIEHLKKQFRGSVEGDRSAISASLPLAFATSCPAPDCRTRRGCQGVRHDREGGRNRGGGNPRHVALDRHCDGRSEIEDGGSAARDGGVCQDDRRARPCAPPSRLHRSLDQLDRLNQTGPKAADTAQALLEFGDKIDRVAGKGHQRDHVNPAAVCRPGKSAGLVQSELGGTSREPVRRTRLTLVTAAVNQYRLAMCAIGRQL